MTIDDAIAMLERLKRKHGGDVMLCFDCPECRQSFTPGTVETSAVHLKGEAKVLQS